MALTLHHRLLNVRRSEWQLFAFRNLKVKVPSRPQFSHCLISTLIVHPSGIQPASASTISNSSGTVSSKTRAQLVAFPRRFLNPAGAFASVFSFRAALANRASSVPGAAFAEARVRGDVLAADNAVLWPLCPTASGFVAADGFRSRRFALSSD